MKDNTLTFILTTRIDGLMKYQHAFQYSQKKKLLLPTIISMSSAKRFPPAKNVRNTAGTPVRYLNLII